MMRRLFNIPSCQRRRWSPPASTAGFQVHGNPASRTLEREGHVRHVATAARLRGMACLSSRQPGLHGRISAGSFRRSMSTMIPRKAALKLTPKARELFKKLIDATSAEGIMLKYELSTKEALRMAFKFDLIKDSKVEITEQDEGVSLEVMEDGSPKPPSESWDDNLPKLYIHHDAFMKVLGGTIDVDFNKETGDLKPILLDREGHEMDPNA